MLELPAQGGCQCGACTYTLCALPFVAYTCHCRACQRLTASAFLTCMQLPLEAVTDVSGPIKLHERVADSGNRLLTAFCPRCGATLYADNSARPRVRTLHVGSLDDPAQVDVTAHIWVSRKLPFVQLPVHHRLYAYAGDWTQDYASDPARYQPAAPS